MALFLYEIMIHKKKSTIFENLKKVWQLATLQPLEAHGIEVPFWKPPISHGLEPGGHGDGRAFRAQKP